MLTRPQRLQRRMMLRFVPMMERWQGRKEATVPARPGVLRAGPTSPERVNIMARSAQVPEMHAPPGFPRVVPQLIGSLRGIKASIDEIDDNPAQPRTTIEGSELAVLEAFARSAGALSIGYATVPSRLVFKDMAVLYPNAVVLTMEMDKARIDTAPSNAAGLAVHETYNHLGQVSNKVARYLRELGFATQAGHPLNGFALYPPMAAAAHLGGRGMHGLLITPEMGPTVRIAAVFTSIENLPIPEGDNPHAWVSEFCDHCRLCARKCPVGAIYTEPIKHPDGRLTCADDGKCLPFFATHDGCTICVAVCPFNTAGYERLHRSVLASGHRKAVAEHTGGASAADV